MAVVDSVYRSPVSKLLPFFQRSRDKWKAKCKAAKRENKSLKIRLAKMKESRDRWKTKARALKDGLPEAVSLGEDSKRSVLSDVGGRGRAREPLGRGTRPGRDQAG